MFSSGFQIGIETEVLLSLRETSQNGVSDLQTVATSVVNAYNSTNKREYPRMHLDIDGQYDGPNDTLEWSITDDVTVRPNSGNNQWPLEIVSPIFQFQPGRKWREVVESLWRTIEVFCTIDTNGTCGTHVHISPPEGQSWQLEQLKCISRSIFYFETAFEVLVPVERRANEYAKSNRVNNPIFQSKNQEQCFQIIDNCRTTIDVADMMNANGDRYYAWNFLNLYYGGKGTIEFRRGPGVTTADACLSWVELAVSFVRAAMLDGTPQGLEKFTPSVAGLKDFIAQALVDGMNNPALLSSLFSGKSGSLHPTAVGYLSPEKQDKLFKKKAQDAKKNITIKKILKTQGK